MQQSLFIPDVQFPGLNDIIKASKAHPMAYSSMKHDWGDLVTALVKRAKLKPMQGKVSVHFNWIEKARRRDPDNIRAGSKFILDALLYVPCWNRPLRQCWPDELHEVLAEMIERRGA